MPLSNCRWPPLLGFQSNPSSWASVGLRRTRLHPLPRIEATSNPPSLDQCLFHHCSSTCFLGTPNDDFQTSKAPSVCNDHELHWSFARPSVLQPSDASLKQIQMLWTLMARPTILVCVWCLAGQMHPLLKGELNPETPLQPQALYC